MLLEIELSSKFNKKMEELFEIESEEENLPTEIKSTSIIPCETLDIDLSKDYEAVRSNYHDLIETGKQALDDILAIAKESEKGRDFEVAAGLLTNILNANQQLIDIHKKIREIANYKQDKESTKTNIENALFVGSTNELSKLIKEINLKDVN